MTKKTSKRKPILHVGASVFIRTVTFFATGRVVALEGDMIELEDAAWIADQGRFFDSLRDGKLNEVEPAPHGMCIGRGAVVDIVPWPHALPKGSWSWSWSGSWSRSWSRSG